MTDPQPVINAIAQFFFAVIVALIPIIIKALYPQLTAWLEAKAHDAQWGTVVNAAFDIAKQVEQLKKVGAIPTNEQALTKGTALLDAWLLSRGLQLPTADLKTAIESAVNDLPHADKAQ